MSYYDKISSALIESSELKQLVAEQCKESIEQAGLLIAETFRNKGKILLCGNGGSASDAQHIATELVVRLSADLEREALPALALNTNSSTLTACGNDYNFDHIYSRQVEAFGNEGDLLIGITTSGNSSNILHAIETAQEKNMKIIGLLGGNGGRIKGECDVEVIVPHFNTARVQECHITIGHILCNIIEDELFR